MNGEGKGLGLTSTELLGRITTSEPKSRIFHRLTQISCTRIFRAFINNQTNVCCSRNFNLIDRAQRPYILLAEQRSLHLLVLLNHTTLERDMLSLNWEEGEYLIFRKLSSMRRASQHCDSISLSPTKEDAQSGLWNKYLRTNFPA